MMISLGTDVKSLTAQAQEGTKTKKRKEGVEQKLQTGTHFLPRVVYLRTKK